MNIIIWSYNGTPSHEPLMGPKIRDMVINAANRSMIERGIDEIHIDHGGTVGDARHAAKYSYHNYHPPEAIDINKFGPWDVSSDLVQRKELADFFTTTTLGRAHFAHVDDASQNHLHVQSGPGAGVRG